ncbi:MAG: DUF934 domain-containing protein [Beijerinckiaceae bacterium]|nr:DUF934 domain-containing protein [Beijerinckiaceae bacterium]
MLLDRDGPRQDDWTRSNDPAAAAQAGRVLFDVAVLPAVLALAPAGRPLGVFIPNTVTAAELAPHLPRLALVAIGFPAFSDGRGFSLAKALRREGFAGALRASGPLIPDQFAYALACGFDEIELPDTSAARQSVSQWLAAKTHLPATYQRGYRRDGNIMEARRQARADKAPS